MTDQRTLNLSSIIVRSSEPLSADVGDETVLMSATQGRYFGLDAICSDVWRRLETPIRVADLCAALAAAYNGEPGLIERDVLDLLNRMLARQLIEMAG